MKEKLHRTIPSRIGRAGLAVILAAGLCPATALASTQTADAATTDTGGSVIQSILDHESENYQKYLETGNSDYITKAADEVVSTSTLSSISLNTTTPTSYDLRDVSGVNYVTPVRDQDPFGSCWAFANSAAAETSILSSTKTAATDSAWLSTKALGYFAFATATQANQAGEGRYITKDTSSTTAQENAIERFDAGGTSWISANMYASGSGPISDATVPYTNSAGKTTKDGDWTVDSKYQYANNYNLLEVNNLPSAAENKDAGKTAIKSEILNGKAVTIGIYADESQPDEKSAGKYITKDNTYGYCYDTGEDFTANHEVCIVGWDDSIEKEKFKHTYTDEEGRSIATTPPDSDGAWIVRNSWGSAWGDAGYFYVSYCDKSLSDAATFTFDTDGTTKGYTTNQNDYMYSSSLKGGDKAYTTEAKSANVFTNTTGKPQTLNQVSVSTTNADSKVTIDVYVMDANADVAKTLASSSPDYTQKDVEEAYAGFHRITLDKAVSIENGKKYVVVETCVGSDGNYYIAYESDVNEATAKAKPTENTTYAKGVVNAGESFVYDSNGWTDWSTTVSSMASSGQAVDNFPIKAYTTDTSDVTYAFVNRLYDKILDRDPDEAGLAAQVAALNAGQAPAEIAYNFFNSKEYYSKAEDASTTIERVYQVMFGRASDDGGKAFWVAKMNDGMSVRAVVAGFSESNEYKDYYSAAKLNNATIPVFAEGADQAWDAAGNVTYLGPNYRDKNQGIAGFSSRMYTKCLARAYDVKGLNDQCKGLQDGMPCYQIAVNFFCSDEFTNLNLSATEKINRCYRTMINRECESDEAMKYWTDRLANERLESVVKGFCQSDEFEAICQQYGMKSGMR